MFAFKLISKLPTAEEYITSRDKLLVVVEKIENHIGNSKKLSEYILSAKDEYTLLTGMLRENDETYIHRIKSFLYWFLYDWYIPPKLDLNPISFYVNELKDNEEKKYYSQLKSNVHSLFLFDKHTKKGVRLINLFSNKPIELADTTSFHGFQHGNWFETRIFNFENKNIFADYFIMHHDSVLKPVRQKIKQLKGNKEAYKKFIFQLQSYYVKWKSYKMIDVKSIYQF